MNTHAGFIPDHDAQLMDQRESSKNREAIKLSIASNSQGANDSVEVFRPLQSAGRRGSSGSSVPVRTEFVYTSSEKHKTVQLHGDWNSWEPIAMHIENGIFPLEGNIECFISR